MGWSAIRSLVVGRLQSRAHLQVAIQRPLDVWGSKVICSLFASRLLLVCVFSHLTFVVVMAADGHGVEMPEEVRDSAPTVDAVDGTGSRGPSS